jgi:Fe-S cluster biogenesis protein NfuA
VGLYTVPAHVDPRRLIRGVIPRKEESTMREKVERALETIRPALRADGGDVELVDVIDGVVTVRLKGACGGCPMSQLTLTRGVEATIKKAVPEVKRVEAA